jgi:hypothetical protein
MSPANSEGPETESTRRARRRNIEGYLSLGLTAMLCAIPFVGDWLVVPKMPIGVPVLLLVIVFGIRGSRSRGGGGMAARLSIGILVAMLITVFWVAFRYFLDETGHPSR